MSLTHEYQTRIVTASDLNNTHVLVGESGGLSAVYNVEPSWAMPGCMLVETEHGALYLGAEEECIVIDNQDSAS